MKLTISKYKNSKSFYIQKSFKNNHGKSSTKTVRKLGTLKELIKELGTDRDSVFHGIGSRLIWQKRNIKMIFIKTVNSEPISSSSLNKK